MTCSIRKFHEIKAQEWDHYVEKHPKSWLWHTHDFITAKNTWNGHSNQSFALYDEHQGIVGIFPLHLIENKTYKIFNTPILDNIGGWLTNDKPHQIEYSQLIIKEFFRRLSQYSCSGGNINFATASINQDIDPLFLYGLSGNRAYLSVIDLTLPHEDIWKKLRKGHKSEIKKAENNNLTFKLALQKDLEIYYDMHKKVCAKSCISPHKREYFEHIFNILLPQGHAYIGTAYLDNAPIAMVNYGIYNGKAVYWTGACFDIAYRVGANHFLHWQMLQNLIERNFSHLDMGEVFYNHNSSKIQGIANFKMGFGGDLRSCFKTTITRSALKESLSLFKNRS